MENNRICKVCEISKDLGQFHSYKNKSRHTCKDCIKIQRREYWLKNKDKINVKHREWLKNNRELTRFHNKKSLYGITKEDYKLLVDKQDNKCAICDKSTKENLFIDHCHSTNKVRGLLCRKCNFLLGHSDNDVEILQKAILYLNNH